ncbi:hypothetical protein MGL_1030 [Malassezia globosa CBS 7966]|uniref:Intermembrane lipid transfer protein VPS13-like C-terminal domain-containing protein n=1 Tax=Malassezia globosa (strain ATCC MYA-4612 / CBS 7966) TaxID=425265 RepID=A8PW57_MALGO|nr:uncharacterized protein MGL_1030 [Malassezia globosa CBS 7966]EDP44548.1 hypothetical protein MGL_1030 [Malassezia globosa CBS 7966]
MFYEPYYGLIMHGNRELGFGIARGASNFVKKTVFGVSDSVSKLTGSISKGLAAVTMDRDFQSRWRAKRFRNKPKHAFYGIATGANSFLTSVASGIEGLALRPLEGAEDGGASGFMQGLGRGLVGALTKPAAGAFDMASSITEGLRNTTLVFEQNSIDRVRLPRFIASDHVVRPFSEREALGQMWLQTMDAGRLVRDEYVAHINTPGPHGGATIMLTETRILYVRTAHLKALWEVRVVRSEHNLARKQWHFARTPRWGSRPLSHHSGRKHTSVAIPSDLRRRAEIQRRSCLDDRHPCILSCSSPILPVLFVFASCVTRNAWATLLRFRSLAQQRQSPYLHIRSSHPTDTHVSAHAQYHVIYT